MMNSFRKNMIEQGFTPTPFITTLPEATRNAHRNERCRGFIALISVLVISAVVLVIGIGVSLRSVGESNMSLGEQESNRARALANLCAEQALMKLESFLNYSGDESIIIGSESCYILAVGGTGNLNRTVQASSTVSNYTKKVQVVITQISPVMQLSSWEEVADF